MLQSASTSAVLCHCQASLCRQQKHGQRGTTTNQKLNHEAVSPSAGCQEGSNLLSEAKRLNTRPVVKECSQYKTKGFPGTGTTGITAMSMIQVVCFRNEFHKFSNSSQDSVSKIYEGKISMNPCLSPHLVELHCFKLFDS